MNLSGDQKNEWLAKCRSAIILSEEMRQPPWLARAKRKVAAKPQQRCNDSADSCQTDICACLSAILLGGLSLNALFGFWWADPVAALIMVPIIAKEGIEVLRGETCDDCH